MNPLAEAYDEEGNIRSAAWEDSSEAFSVNPLSSLNNKSNDIRSKVITNNVVEIKLPFVPGLSYKLNTGYTYQNSSWKQYQGMDTYYGARSNGILNTDDWHSSSLTPVNSASIASSSPVCILHKATRKKATEWKAKTFRTT